MLFKGVTHGKFAGDVMEYSAEEKVPHAVQKAISEYPEFKDKVLVWIKDHKLRSVTFSPNGSLFKKKWQNNLYTAIGEVTINRRRVEPDRLLQPITKTFQISFKDSLDHLSLPDLDVVTFTLED
jgi:hypothetical protein